MLYVRQNSVEPSIVKAYKQRVYKIDDNMSNLGFY